MPATTYEKQALVHFTGTAGTDPEETVNGAATKFRFAQKDGYGDDANTRWYDVVATKDPLRAAIRDQVYKGAKLAIEGNEKVDREYNPEKPRYTIFPAAIFSITNIKGQPAKAAAETDEF